MSDNESEQSSATRLINSTIRGYMDTLSLQRFYGGYSITPLEPGVFNLGIGEVGNLSLPAEVYALYRDYMGEKSLEPLVTRYSGTLGQQRTNAAMAAHLNSWLGEERIPADQVVSFDGGHNGVEVALRVFTAPLGGGDPGKHYVLLATPSYPYFSSIVAAQAGIHSFVAFDAEAFTQGVERNCHAEVGAILINVPHNPMGYALDPGQVGRINQVARRHECALIVDGVYANYPASAETGRALAGLDPERTVFIDSFSKKFGLPGLRIGFGLSAAAELTYAMRFVKTAESLTPSASKLAFAGYLLESHGDLPAMIGGEIRKRKERFLESFQPERRPGLTLSGGADNAFYAALDISALARQTGLNDAQVGQYCLNRHKVRVFPGAFVYPNPALAFQIHPNDGAPAQPVSERPFLMPPDGLSARRPLLRLSFGMETRMEEAAAALTRALDGLWELGTEALGALETPDSN